VLSADVCRHLIVMQAFIPGVISRCLQKPDSHAGIYSWCYQQMSAETCNSCRHLFMALSADVCRNLIVMQAFILVLSAYVCRNLLVMQAFIPGVVSPCLRKPASHAGIYTWCYQQMSAETCKSCRYLFLVLSANVCRNLLVMQAFFLVLSADVCRNLLVMQALTPGFISRNLLVMQALTPGVIS